jgi:hypothetical protein
MAPRVLLQLHSTRVADGTHQTSCTWHKDSIWYTQDLKLLEQGYQKVHTRIHVRGTCVANNTHQTSYTWHLLSRWYTPDFINMARELHVGIRLTVV